VRLGRAEIARLIPHSGSMCLLDGVVQWDADRIRCISRGHRAADNPLRSGDQLPALCGIEYAMQAMAVHGGLTGKVGGRPRAGYLASLRNLDCRAVRLDDRAGDLLVEAELVAGESSHASYRFTLQVGGVEVLSGQALVVLDAAAGA
jgi:predicted hotdog family 3-hydroxylacyl-ACP dehydratase